MRIFTPKFWPKKRGKILNTMQIIDKSSYKLPAGIRKILLIQLGDIGDVVWTTPGIRAVKNSLPGAKVSVMVKEHFGSLLQADPSVDQIFEIKHTPGNIFRQAAGQLSFLKKLRAERFDLVVDLRLGDRGAFMAFATGAPIRVTMHHEGGLPWWRNYCFSHAAIPASVPPERGATEQSLRILRALGIDTNDKIPRLWISDAVKQNIRTILTRAKAADLEHWITINPFSRWQYKEWVDSGWVEMVNWLWQDFAIPTLIIGSPEEEQKAEALIRQCKGLVFNFAGKTTLAELAGLLNQSLLHIGVDSAAPHIAAAVGVPTVTIYGPSSWYDWAPVGENHRVVLPEMDCVPCRQKGCDGGGQSLCLEQLMPASVKKVIRESIEAHCPKLSRSRK
jgi:heptosyltransferase-3